MFLFVIQMNPGSLGSGLFQIIPQNDTCVPKGQFCPRMPGPQASSVDTAPQGCLRPGMGNVKVDRSSTVFICLHTRLY